MIKTVLFDLDGTLIDTEKYYRICWPMALKHFGYEMTDEQALYMRSLGRPFAPEHFKTLYGEDFDYVKVKEYRKALMEDVLKKNGIEVKPGAVELLKWLKENGYRCAVATASDLERTERYLRTVGLLEYFDDLISATQVKFGKPRPDIYLFACEKLGVSPADTLAVEDSPNGIISAADAGCRVVMVPDQTEPDEELKARLYARVDSLSDIIQLLNQS